MPNNKVETDDAGLAAMRSLVRETTKCLHEITPIEAIWHRGVVHRGGPHYRLKGTLGPVSLGEDECLVFGRLIQELHPVNCFIIGNAFGMSSAFIAKMMEIYGGKSVVTLDSKSEGDGDRCFTIAGELGRCMNCRLLINKIGWSPKDIDRAADDESYDLIFIDGDHSHPQVSRDFEGIRHLAHEKTVICWHDYWMAGVPESVDMAQRDGFRCVKVNSSCEIVFGTRSEEVRRRIASLYTDVEDPRKRHRPIAYLKLYHSLLIGGFRNHFMNRVAAH